MRNVLFVDDEDDIRTIAQIALEPEFRFTPAASAQEALDSVAHERPDLVVLDLMMPGVDGYEALRRMRAMPNGVAPVVLLTAKPVAFDEELRGLGVVAVVQKPFDPLALPGLLRTWMGAG